MRVAIFGRGEAAELSYLSLKEFGLEPVAIFDDEGGHDFLGMPVLPISRARGIELRPDDRRDARALGPPIATLSRTACRKTNSSRSGRTARRAASAERPGQANGRNGPRAGRSHGSDRQARVHHRRRRLHRIVSGPAPHRGQRGRRLRQPASQRDSVRAPRRPSAPALHQGRRDGLRRDPQPSTAARSSSTAPRSPACIPSIATP